MANEIIPFISDNFPVIMSSVNTIVGYLLTVIFLRNNTSTQEFEKIKAGLFNEVLNDLLKNGKMTYTEFYKAKNFLCVAKKADEYYKYQSQGTTTKENLEFDWFIRLYENVGNVSDEKIQDLWARILSGEINNPGSISFKTIEVLKCIGKCQAELFEKVCSYSFIHNDVLFFPRNEDYLKNINITYSELMLLDEIGLINCYGNTSLRFSLSNDYVLLFNTNSEVVIAKSKKGNIPLSIDSYPFTHVGCELYRVLSITTNSSCLYKFVKELPNNTSCTIEIHKILEIVDGIVKFDEKNLLYN